MKEALVKFGRGVYDTWYGATVTFLVVSILLHGLQMVNVCLNDVVPWPKEVHVLIMMLLVLNVCVATIVSLVRRKWARALGQVIMLGASFVCCAFVTLMVYCTPTRMTIPPGDEWVCETISMKTNIGKEKLNFLGGISARESVVVYEVVDEAIDDRSFSPGVPWTNVKARAHYQRIMGFCRITVSIPDDAVFSYCDAKYGFITLIKANNKTYLVYERL
jgi:hypothetical protein